MDVSEPGTRKRRDRGNIYSPAKKKGGRMTPVWLGRLITLAFAFLLLKVLLTKGAIAANKICMNSLNSVNKKASPVRKVPRSGI